MRTPEDEYKRFKKQQHEASKPPIKMYGQITDYGYDGPWGQNSVKVGGQRLLSSFDDRKRDWEVGDFVVFYLTKDSYSGGWHAGKISKVSLDEFGDTPLSSDRVHPTILVFCQTEFDEPHLHVSQPAISYLDWKSKTYIDQVKAEARALGFTGPMTVLDANDEITHQMRDALKWL